MATTFERTARTPRSNDHYRKMNSGAEDLVVVRQRRLLIAESRTVEGDV
eukprot:CAMPEP_0119317146 /NCGR_PEP_ID=MMETSP1333-20130426/42128_1 /TAXON_ID=418940 /ORGANISM="Scyphosphaera apsteinii, Strain RCC1455" /LENGTH=48 /DNA_ID= /DNA_START= /DNA_END= /DNA_ORIENTATION=